MNRTLSNLKISSFYDVNHLQKYEICRKESACYLLSPPPRPPSIPELFLTTSCKLSLSSSSTLTNIRSRSSTDSSYLTIISIILGILIALTSACLILFLLGVKFRFHYKLKYRHRRTTDVNSVNSSIRETNSSDVTFIKQTNTNINLGSNSSSGGGGADGCTSFSSVLPIAYECSTPLTTTTIAHNPYPSLTMTNNSNLSLHMIHSQAYRTSDETSLSHLDSTNIYEEIRPTFDRHSCCCCCSCTLAHYQQQQCISSNPQLTPHYYTCEPQLPSSNIVCQTCLLETIRRKKHAASSMNCVCRNFFVPIK